ncbi:TPA: hypothetical protein EYP26_01695, partial [Candidatus Bathyarchaeota archaeon]|nr:hypothetical protein [Candidatus Bathyarchaeota archaeon]
MIVPVKKLTVITLSNNERRLLDALGRLGVVQLRKLDEAEFVGFKEAAPEEIREYEDLYERLRSLQEKLGVTPEKVGGLEFDKIKALSEELRASIEEFEKRAAALEGKLNESRERLKALEEAKPALQILKEQK